MQAIIQLSRSISQDQFYQRRKGKELQLHSQKIMAISSSHFRQPEEEEKIDKLSNQLKKAKSAAKLYSEQQIIKQRRLENKSMLDRMKDISSPYDRFNQHPNSAQKKILEHGLKSVKRKQQIKVKKENELISQKFEQLKAVKVKDYKKKIAQEIKEYLELKQHVRKIKDQRPVTSKQFRISRSSSLKSRQKSSSKRKSTSNIQSPLQSSPLELGVIPEQQKQTKKQTKIVALKQKSVLTEKKVNSEGLPLKKNSKNNEIQQKSQTNRLIDEEELSEIKLNSEKNVEIKGQATE